MAKRRLPAVTALVIAGFLACLACAPCLADAASDFQHAQELYDAGDYDGALALFNSVAASDPSLAPEAKRMVAACYSGKLVFSLALSTLDELLAVYPDTATAVTAKHDKALVLLAGFHEPEQARDLWNELLVRCPESETVVMWKFYIALSWYSEGNWTQARDAFHALYQDYPTSDWRAQAKYSEGDCCAQLRNDTGARAAFQEVIDSYPGTEWAEAASERLASGPAQP